MFATGVTIVTALDAERPADRPDRQLVQLGLDGAAAGALEPVAPCRLDAGVRGAARTTRSTSSRPSRRRWPSASPARTSTASTAWRIRDGASGVPLLDGAAAVFECFNRSRYEEGDHVIFVGEVEHCARREGRQAADLPRRALLHRAAAVAATARCSARLTGLLPPRFAPLPPRGRGRARWARLGRRLRRGGRGRRGRGRPLQLGEGGAVGEAAALDEDEALADLAQDVEVDTARSGAGTGTPAGPRRAGARKKSSMKPM